MDEYVYEAVFVSLTYRAVITKIEGKRFIFSLSRCHFEPDPLDLVAGDKVTIHCPSWLAEKMQIDQEV